MNRHPVARIASAWLKGREVTPALIRELMPGSTGDAQERAWDKWQAFLAITPFKESLSPLEEAVVLLRCTRFPEHFEAFDALSDRPLKEQAWRSLPDAEKIRLKPIIKSYMEQKQ